jgi:Na+-transporting NADH:ubiquinone oxidoreductase subunit NqrC
MYELGRCNDNNNDIKMIINKSINLLIYDENKDDYLKDSKLLLLSQQKNKQNSNKISTTTTTTTVTVTPSKIKTSTTKYKQKVSVINNRKIFK